MTTPHGGSTLPGYIEHSVFEEEKICMSLVHGGNVYEVAARLGCDPDSLLDYSASINPLGPPPGLLEEMNIYYKWLQHYPDIGNRSLLEALCRFHEIPLDQVLVGNGSTELIYWLPKLLGIHKAVVVLPTFSEYGKAFELQGVSLSKLITSPERHFQPTVEQLESLCNAVSPEAILFTHPGSPAGTLLPRAVREWLLEKSRKEKVYCIVDEAFVDFCEGESLKGFLNEWPNLVLIRSMTKFYGIPGLRVGYLLTSRGIAGSIKDSLPPWSVGTLAQIGGVYCLGREEYRRETLKLVEAERRFLSESIGGIDGFRVFPGEANYLLVELDEKLPPTSALQMYLLSSHRILVRDCSSFEGMGDHYLRLAIRLPEQNRKIVDGIKDWAARQA